MNYYGGELDTKLSKLCTSSRIRGYAIFLDFQSSSHSLLKRTTGGAGGDAAAAAARELSHRQHAPHILSHDAARFDALEAQRADLLGAAPIIDVPRGRA